MTRRAAEPQGGETIRVIMTKSMPGSEDGIRVQRYESGETYELGKDLATSFLKSKCARPAPEAPKAPAANPEGGDQTKGGKGPDENK